MKKTTMKWVLLIVVSGSVSFSCKKEKADSAECSISMTGLAGVYKLTALQYKLSATAPAVDYLAYMDDCEKDDSITLNSNGTYDHHDAGTACTPDESDHGSWQLKGNTLISDGTLNGTVASYDCKTLVYYTENTLTTGDRLTFTMAKKQ